MIPLYVCMFFALMFFSSLVDERRSMPRYLFLQSLGLMCIAVLPLYLIIRMYTDYAHTAWLTVMLVLFGGAAFTIMQGYVQGWLLFWFSSALLAGLQADMDVSDRWQLVLFILTLVIGWEGYGKFCEWKEQRRARLVVKPS